MKATTFGQKSINLFLQNQTNYDLSRLKRSLRIYRVSFMYKYKGIKV